MADREEISILHFPAEIIETIICQPCLCFVDIANISQACSSLQELCCSNEIWKMKLQQRWPRMLDRYDRHSNCIWRDECKNRSLFGHKVRSLVKNLSSIYIHAVQEDIQSKDFSEFSALLCEHEHAGYFLVDALMMMINEGDSHENLTTKYYGEKALRYVHQQFLSSKIRAFLQLPPEKQSLEAGAVYIAWWFQPLANITENSVAHQLDCLANEVRDLLNDTYPHHPLLTTNFRTKDVMNDLWTCEQCKMVLDAVNTTLYKVHKFTGKEGDSSVFINQALATKTGVPTALGIIYASIARRLGVVCEPVCFTSDFLRWRQHQMATVDQQYTYIDVVNGGMFRSPETVARKLNIDEDLLRRETSKTQSPKQVIELMTNDILSTNQQLAFNVAGDIWQQRTALDLAVLVTPGDINNRLQQVRVNLQLNINLPEVIDSLQTIADSDQNSMGLVAYLMNIAQSRLEENKQTDRQVKLKTRISAAKDVKYCIGLVMRHRRYDYMCVISGWDGRCVADKRWIRQMGVSSLPRGEKQPFYNVLVKDGSNRYAAEENLEPHDSPQPIDHPQVGRYFQEYRGTHYLPNAENSAHYPDDLCLLEELTRQHYGE